jgi:primary-amine oxidase
MSLLPQGLYIKVGELLPQLFSSTLTHRISEGRAVDPLLWRVSQWYYNGILYTSTSMLRDAMDSPGFEICPHNRDGNWTDTEDLTDGDPGRRLPPPVMIQPQGPRFAIDKKQNFISWMGFEFFISTSSDTGVALHDIRFNGDSVIYELGLQEALSHYAGNDPALGGLLFLDTLFFMGSTMFELVPGYDCPAYAAFLPTTFNQRESTTTVLNSICIFEYTADYPLQRHTADYRVSVSRNTYLVVRSVSTVGNYDYTIEYIFYLDGTVEVKYRASGYIITAFWPQKDNKDNEYGYRIHDAVSSSMHDHVLNFKADLDVDGTSNTLTRVAIEPISRQFSWDEEQASPRNTMHLVKRPVENETGIDWPRNSGEMYIVTNENSTNVWGEKRGYRIQPGTGIGAPPHLSILNSTALGRSAGWSSSDIWVVKQKDNEPKSASHLNFLDPFEPLVDFSKFVDGESTLQEDLSVPVPS